MTHEKTDALLREALSTNEAPSEAFLERLRAQLSRQTDEAAPCSQAAPHSAPLRPHAPRRLRAAAVVLALLLALGMTAYAVTDILSGGQISRLWGDASLSRAFADTGIPVFAQKEAGGYRFTLTELVAGADLSEKLYQPDFQADSRMYVALAIERIDGASMAQELTHDISPLLQGYEPWNWNVYTLHTTMQVSVHEGVQYTILACDDFSALADTGVKLLIATHQKTGMFTECVSFDRETGDITLKPGYEDEAVLFDLPIPEKYADAEKAKAFFAQTRGSMAREAAAQNSIGANAASEAFFMVGNATSADVPQARDSAFWEDAKVLEDTRQPLAAQDDCAYYTYEGDASDKERSLYLPLSSNFKGALEAHCPPEQKIIAKVIVDGHLCKAVMLERDEKGFITSAVVLEKPMPSPAD